MTDSVIPLRFNVEEVGKHVKSSKKRFTWEVSLNSRQHSIVLDFSFISGKVKVAVDRKVLLENELPANTSFQYPFTLDGNSLNVIQQGESFELRINNKVFSHLYNQMKTNKEFKKYEDEIKDFKVNENQFKAEKITLNIGGMGGGMKRKPKVESTEGHSWNAFGGDEMSGFPNYFEGQSVSTTSSEKVEEKPQVVQVAQRKVSNDLLGDVSVSTVTTQKEEMPQNILDFEAEVQNTPLQTGSSKVQDDFNTMQLMFQSMNMNQTPKSSVVVDNNEVDFFNISSVESNTNNTSTANQPASIDFFADLSTPVSNNPVPSVPAVSSPQQPAVNFNTMSYNFATNSPKTSSDTYLNQFGGFNTSVNQMKPSVDFNWNATSSPSKKPESANLNINLNPIPSSSIEPNNFSTLQGLFATNAMGVSQPTNVITSPVVQQQTSVSNQQNNIGQTNFNLNAQHFATQQIPTQSFGTSNFKVNPQAFGTQSFMGQNFGNQELNFLGQQNVTSQPISQPISPPQSQSFIQQNVSVPQQSTEINPKNFGSMQMAFKTSNVPVQQNIQIPSQSNQNQSFSQQFATTSGLIQSPNTMFMNTYGGSNNNANLSFDLGLNQQQFATSINQPSMMKKKAPETVSPADLL